MSTTVAVPDWIKRIADVATADALSEFLLVPVLTGRPR